jgi:hypothetical protein
LEIPGREYNALPLGGTVPLEAFCDSYLCKKAKSHREAGVEAVPHTDGIGKALRTRTFKDLLTN